jgi:large subunit ribosomal protein L6
MSKIGRRPISIPSGVTITQQNDMVMVKGPKGELTTPIASGVVIAIEDNELVVSRKNDEKQTRANHGLMRSLIQNTVVGVTDGYKITLKMLGTGYRVQKTGNGLNLQVGFSHDVPYVAPQGITITVEGNDTIVIQGIDKQKVGQVAAEVRKIKPPEPYKGKGIRYEDEVVRRKQGKAAAK